MKRLRGVRVFLPVDGDLGDPDQQAAAGAIRVRAGTLPGSPRDRPAGGDPDRSARCRVPLPESLPEPVATGLVA